MTKREFLYGQLWLYRLICSARQVFYHWRLGRLTDNHKALFAVLLPLAIPYGFVVAALRRNQIAGQIANDLVKPFDDELSMVAILKNEAPYVREWVEYYRLLGATKFYIYDNDSQDNVKDVISDYIDAGIVVYEQFPGRYIQNMAYTHAIQKYAHRTRFMAVVDLDEFIVPVDDKRVFVDILTKILRVQPHAAGVGIPWLMFGSSHHKTRPNGLVIDSYLHRAPDSFSSKIKTVFNPRLVIGFNNPHYPVYKYGAISVNENGREIVGKFDRQKSCTQLRINHYFTKSEEEYRAKVARGTGSKFSPRRFESFVDVDRNEIYDTTILRYSERIRRILQKGAQVEDVS